MYTIIKPIKQEEDTIWVEIAETDFEKCLYHRVMNETEIEIYTCPDRNSVVYWLTFVGMFFESINSADEFFPEDVEFFQFEFDYFTHEKRILMDRRKDSV